MIMTAGLLHYGNTLLFWQWFSIYVEHKILVLGMGYLHIFHIVCRGKKYCNNRHIVILMSHCQSLWILPFHDVFMFNKPFDNHSKLSLCWLWTILYQKRYNSSNILSILFIFFRGRDFILFSQGNYKGVDMLIFKTKFGHFTRSVVSWIHARNIPSWYQNWYRDISHVQ